MQGVGDDVEDARGQMHGAERMFESSVARPRIDQVSESELTDPPQALHRPGVQYFPLVRTDLDEIVDGVSNFVCVLRQRHARSLSSTGHLQA